MAWWRAGGRRGSRTDRLGALAIAAAIAAVLTVGAFAGLRAGVFGGYRLIASDAFFPSETTDPNIAIVAVDRASILDSAQPWPWPRDVQGALVSSLAAEHPRLIVLDFVYSPPTSQDPALAAAIAGAGDVVVASAAELERPAGASQLRARSLTPPAPAIAEAADAIGHVSVTADPADGVVRTLPLVVSARGEVIPSLSLAALMRLEGVGSALTVRPGGVQVGGRFVPTEGPHALDINYSDTLSAGSRSAPLISASDVMRHRVEPGRLAGKVVLVGVTDPTLGDQHLTPVDKRVGEGGVYIHANALNTMVTESYLTPASTTETLVWVFALAFIAALATRVLRLWLAAVLVVVVGALYLVVAFVRFDAGHVSDLVYPPLALVLAFVISLAVRLQTEAGQRRRMGRLLSQYVPATMVGYLLSRGGAGLPTGEITFLLTDVVGSTAVWELEPRAMGGAICRHDALINEAVEANGGAMVRPRGEGDSRFAVFLDAADAARAAVAIHRSLEAEPWKTSSPLRVRTGIHTGEAELREGDYYGTVVNRCARIRASGEPGQILLSAATAALVDGSAPDGTALTDLGPRPLKDITEPEDVWELTVDRNGSSTEPSVPKAVTPRR